MCGIAGWLPGLQEHHGLFERVAESMKHRGPDEQTSYKSPEVGFVHARLKIIDLSINGSQPMINEDGSIRVIFNGEIYNHHELRRELEAKGHKFRGRSDTEVIPHLYEEYGIEFVKRLRGEFAIALYDHKRRKLIIARDRFGIKPLFYAPSGEYFAFASEINSLKLTPGIDLRPDHQSVSDFAAMLFIPAPETFYRGIRALEPGHLIEVEEKDSAVTWSIKKWHSWQIKPNHELTIEEAVEKTDQLLSASVKRQLESDVELGTLLSGGIDSSLISAYAQDALSGKLKTYNVQFSDQAYDETWAAVAVANSISSEHQTLQMPQFGGSWEHITRLLSHTGQPFADTSFFAVQGVSSLMSQKLTVALSGDGGDEGFGGYHHFLRAGLLSKLRLIPRFAWSAVRTSLGLFSPINSSAAALRRQMSYLSHTDSAALIQASLRWIRDEEHSRLMNIKNVLPPSRWFEPQWEHNFSNKASSLERLSAHMTEVDVRLILTNDYLFKVDIASMSVGLEVRVPMLDEDLIDFALTIPHDLKVNSGVAKRILRELAKRKLPAEVANKPKQGFSIPVDRWVDSKFRGQLRSVMLDRNNPVSEFLNQDIYKGWVLAFCEEREYSGISRAGLYQRIIMLLALYLGLGGKPDR